MEPAARAGIHRAFDLLGLDRRRQHDGAVCAVALLGRCYTRKDGSQQPVRPQGGADVKAP